MRISGNRRQAGMHEVDLTVAGLLLRADSLTGLDKRPSHLSSRKV